MNCPFRSAQVQSFFHRANCYLDPTLWPGKIKDLSLILVPVPFLTKTITKKGSPPYSFGHGRSMGRRLNQMLSLLYKRMAGISIRTNLRCKFQPSARWQLQTPLSTGNLFGKDVNMNGTGLFSRTKERPAVAAADLGSGRAHVFPLFHQCPKAAIVIVVVADAVANYWSNGSAATTVR